MVDLQLNKTQANSRVNILVLVVFFIIFVPSAYSPGINKVSLYVLIPILFLYSVFIDSKLILSYKPIFYLLLIYFWSLLTMTMSVDMALSLREIRQITGVFLLCSIFIHFCFVNPKYIYVFYLLYIIRFFYIFYYAYSHDLFQPEERFNLEELNSNEFGYFGFFSIVSAFFLWRSVQHILLRIFLFFLFLLCMSLSVLSCFYAASRAGMALSLSTAAILMFVYYFYPLSKKSLYGIILLIIIVMTLVPVLTFYYQGSILESRFQIESLKNDSRIGLIFQALEVGYQNPVFGVGPGNFVKYSGVYETFSHCSYTELLANNGIVALGLFISILYFFYKKNRQLYLKGHDSRKIAMFFYGIFLLYCIYNLFYGFYLNLFMMGFFYVLLVHLEESLNHAEN